MEWRVFLPTAGVNSSDTGDIWDLLQSRPRHLWPESRTDVYLACSPTAGVKLRGNKTLEVKLRSRRNELGAEHWDKVGGASTYIAAVNVIMLIVVNNYISGSTCTN